jgi:hypothetical protein
MKVETHRSRKIDKNKIEKVGGERKGNKKTKQKKRGKDNKNFETTKTQIKRKN